MEGSTLESPGIIKRNGVCFNDSGFGVPHLHPYEQVYYLFASHTSGWAPNPNKYFTSNVRRCIFAQCSQHPDRQT